MADEPKPPPVPPRQVGILVLNDDAYGQASLRQVLDAEGWRVRVVPDMKLFLAELKSGDWSLVIANPVLTGVDTPLFATLREITSIPVEEGGRLRILYVVPGTVSDHYGPALEHAKMPYVVQPFHFHDFLEKISDLLLEIKAIDAPLRQVRHEFGTLRKKKRQAARSHSMFASRDSFSYSEEEIAEYERAEAEANKAKRPKRITDLGNPHR
jgi:DNA-binding response OmpR family regulator